MGIDLEYQLRCLEQLASELCESGQFEKYQLVWILDEIERLEKEIASRGLLQ